jgi:hypothetical protein
MWNLKAFACFVLISAILFSGALFVGSGQASTNVTGIINSDAIWNSAGSPYTLTGPTAVNQGVTLTIEPGVTVNLGDYYIQVNGTLVAEGTSSNPINLNGGQIVFTSVSKGWNEQTGKGNLIENAKINSISSSNSIKINNNQIVGSLSVGNLSIVSYNKISYNPNYATNQYVTNTVTVGDSCKVEGNTITGTVMTGDNVTISHNTLGPGNQESSSDQTELTTGRSCSITDNTITGVTNLPNMFASEVAKAINVAYESVISNNKIEGLITGSPSEITGNTIEGGGTSKSWGLRDTYSVYAISIDSPSCQFSSNTIKATTGGAVKAQTASFTSNVIYGEIGVSNTSTFKSNVIAGAVGGGNLFQNNKIEGLISPQGPAVISGNSINGEIYCNDFSCEISDNTITYGGISGAAGNIHNNLITNGSGISTDSAPATITANTISRNSVGISVGAVPPTISNNNIEDNTQNILITGSSDVNAIDNWWGTTDTQAINNTIHDFNSDFNLGKVNILPILTEPNSQAIPNPNINLPTAPFPSTPTSTSSPHTSSSGGVTVEGLLSWFGVFFILLLVVALVVVIIVVMIVKRTGKRNLPLPPPPPA